MTKRISLWRALLAAAIIQTVIILDRSAGKLADKLEKRT